VAADGVREAVAVARALAVYRGSVVPRVRAGLKHWEGAAETIPDPVLREHALTALCEKGRNVEATAVFAILAPRRTRPAAVAAMTTLQIAVDYLDTLGEQPAADPLANGLALHGALVDALSPGEPVGDWYRLNPQRDDGGYLAALVAACREAVAALPEADAILPAARLAARRCGEGQSQTHATEIAARQSPPGTERGAVAASGSLETWALTLDAPPGYAWWELAAGASSSVAAHALIAAAADARTTPADAETIDAAYFPSIGALTVLLDDLVDRDEDLAGGAHNYTTYYRDGEEAAARLALLAGRARSATTPLRNRDRHNAILVGVAGFYLAAPGARSAYAAPAAEALLDALGPSVRLIATFMRRR
jgi:tetraprenyl-beta-curcumene synthase